jgi:hypothetical protein
VLDARTANLAHNGVRDLVEPGGSLGRTVESGFEPAHVRDRLQGSGAFCCVEK